MAWLINSDRATVQPRADRSLDLAQRPDIVRLNDGAHPAARLKDLAPGSPVAIEIPRDWTSLQSLDYETAWFWRQTTDQILSALLGPGDDRYMITAVGRDGGRSYLIAEPTARIAGQTAPFAERCRVVSH
jgi:predicted GNAT superfamily acetyltransferase